MEHRQREAKHGLEALLDLVDGRPALVGPAEGAISSVSHTELLGQSQAGDAHSQLVVDVVLTEREDRYEVGP